MKTISFMEGEIRYYLCVKTTSVTPKFITNAGLTDVILQYGYLNDYTVYKSLYGGGGDGDGYSYIYVFLREQCSDGGRASLLININKDEKCVSIKKPAADPIYQSIRTQYGASSFRLGSKYA